MNTPTWIVDAGNEASRVRASKEENQNYLPELNYGSSTNEATLSAGGSNAEVPAAVEPFTPAISKTFNAVAFGEKWIGGQYSAIAPNRSETPLVSNIESVPQTPKYRSPNPELKKLSISAVTPVCVKVSVTDMSPMSDCDIIRLDCSEDDLAIGKMSDVEDSLSKKHADRSEWSDDDEELLKMRQDVLNSRGKRRAQSDAADIYAKSSEDKALLLRCEEDRLKSSDKEEADSRSDLDPAFVDDLLKSSDEEEPQKRKDGYLDGSERTVGSVDVGFNETDVKRESAQRVVKNGDDFLVDSTIIDEECLNKDSDFELNGVSTGAKDVALVNECKLLASINQVGASEEELLGGEEHKCINEEGHKVFSEHSDYKYETDLRGEHDVLNEEDDELEVLFMKENKGVGPEPSEEILNKEPVDEGVERSVNFGEVQLTKSPREELAFGEKQYLERRDEVNLPSGEESAPDETVDYFLDVLAGLLEDEDVSSLTRSIVVDGATAEFEDTLTEDVDGNELGKICESIPLPPQQHGENDKGKVQDSEVADDYLVTGSGEVPISKLCSEYLSSQLDEEVSVPLKIKEESGSQICKEDTLSPLNEVPAKQIVKAPFSSRTVIEAPISKILEDAVVSGLRSPEKVSGAEEIHRIETVSSQGIEKVLDSQSTEETPVSRRAGFKTSRRVEVVVPQRVEEVPVLQRTADFNVSQRVDNSFTRRDGQSRPVPLLGVRPLLPTPNLPSATFTRRDGTYPYQRNVNFAEDNQRSRQGPILSDRWGNQQTIGNFHFSGPTDFSADINTDFSTDFMWDFEHNAPARWNHIPNGPTQLPTAHFPNETPHMGFDNGFAADPSGYFGGAQIPPLLADETSSDSKPGGFLTNVAKSYDNFNEEEIRDNNDPRWEEIRSLKTDAERYASLLNRWGSPTMPDPRKNLTTHNYLRRKRARNSQETEARMPIFTNGRKRKASSSPFGERPGKRLCSILDDKFEDVDRKTAEEIKRLNDQRTFEIDKIERGKEETISDLLTAYGPHFFSDGYFERLEYDSFQRKEQINNHFGRIIDDVWKWKIKETEELKSALDEMVAFYKFYGDDSNVHLTPEEVETFVEQERMFSLYDNFYSS